MGWVNLRHMVWPTCQLTFLSSISAILDRISSPPRVSQILNRLWGEHLVPFHSFEGVKHFCHSVSEMTALVGNSLKEPLKSRHWYVYGLCQIILLRIEKTQPKWSCKSIKTLVLYSWLEHAIENISMTIITERISSWSNPARLARTMMSAFGSGSITSVVIVYCFIVLAKMQHRLFLWMYPSQTLIWKHNDNERRTFQIYRISNFSFSKLIFNGSTMGTFTIATKSLFLKHYEGLTHNETLLVSITRVNKSIENIVCVHRVY